MTWRLLLLLLHMLVTYVVKAIVAIHIHIYICYMLLLYVVAKVREVSGQAALCGIEDPALPGLLRHAALADKIYGNKARVLSGRSGSSWKASVSPENQRTRLASERRLFTAGVNGRDFSIRSHWQDPGLKAPTPKYG